MFEIGHNSFVRSHLHPSIAILFWHLNNKSISVNREYVLFGRLFFSYVIVDNKHFMKIPRLPC